MLRYFQYLRNIQNLEVLLICICFTSTPIQTANLNAIKAIGRSDLYLKLEVIESIYAIILLIIVARINPLLIAVMFAISEFLNCVLISFVNKKLINYGFGEQFKDLLWQYLMALIMALTVYGIGLLSDSLLLLPVQVLLGVIIYVFLSKITNNPNYMTIKDQVIKRIRRGKKNDGV